MISKKEEREAVSEFFELFKTPWEFYRRDRSYDVIISTLDEGGELDARLVVIYGCGQGRFDFDHDIVLRSRQSETTLTYDCTVFPVYTGVLVFRRRGRTVIEAGDTGEPTGLAFEGSKRTIIRVGYNLFEEVSFLFARGQPAHNALVPTLEIHRSMVRDWMVHAGMSVLEVPPVPGGYDFIVCLTHDVDFAGIRHHKLDHTVWGFLYRALLGSLFNIHKRKRPLRRLQQNWKAVLSLPRVYRGQKGDFWLQFDRYLELEKDLGSTFFVIPFKNRAGCDVSGQTHYRRAARYDVTDIQSQLKTLRKHRCEIGLHGIDAWQDVQRARQECNRLSTATGQSPNGVRMHWLYYDGRSPRILEQAGLWYDSTCGYNDAVGFRGGTTQVFRPPGVQKLLEMPMNIQDTALFIRMGLSDNQALQECQKAIHSTLIYGGVLVVNWHHRSIAPERLWDDFYVRLLEELMKYRIWFATAHEIVNWFDKRRCVRFERMQSDNDRIALCLTRKDESGPSLSWRTYHPKGHTFQGEMSSRQLLYDEGAIPVNGEATISFTTNFA